jgi:hypothetical protein
MKQRTHSFSNEVLQKVQTRSGLSGKSVERSGMKAEYVHLPRDPDFVNRLYITAGELTVELLPSKGLSIGEVFQKHRPLLWDTLLASLPDPRTVNLHGPLLWNGRVVEGFRFIEYFVGGLIMFGLSNWGMPYTDPITAQQRPLHGQVSNIPIEVIQVQLKADRVEVTGTLRVRDGVDIENMGLWYQTGREVYHVTKRVIVDRNRSRVTVSDRITNVSARTLQPDWGYSIKFHAELGAKYLVPSTHIENRFDNHVPPDHELWSPAAIENKMNEKGIIHRGLNRAAGLIPTGSGVETLVLYADGTGIRVILPEVPYFLSWYSAGGRGSREFLLPEGKPLDVFRRNWDGLGPEFGSSALDHDGNVDPEVAVQPLEPGDHLDVCMLFETVAADAAKEIAERIWDYNQRRLS